MDNFDLKKFMVENKLTTNSKMLKERNDIVPTKDLKASDAFRDAGIDMSKPVLVVKQDGGHGEPERVEEVPAAKALAMFKSLRAQGAEMGREDHYEFDNELDYNVEGYEYKLSYFEEESTTTSLYQSYEDATSKIEAEIEKVANSPVTDDAPTKDEKTALAAEIIYDKYRMAGDEDRAEIAKSIMRAHMNEAEGGLNEEQEGYEIGSAGGFNIYSLEGSSTEGSMMYKIEKSISIDPAAVTNAKDLVTKYNLEPAIAFAIFKDLESELDGQF